MVDLRRGLVRMAAGGQLLMTLLVVYWTAVTNAHFADSLRLGGETLDRELGVAGVGIAAFVAFFLLIPLANAALATVNLGPCPRWSVMSAWVLNLANLATVLTWGLVMDNGWPIAGVDWYEVNRQAMWFFDEDLNLQANALTIFTFGIAFVVTALLTYPAVRPQARRRLAPS
ncbi:hypothetical protein [Phytomonospora endophytica]|uniref:DMSO/TMAO reductase YedYZ heme-binding membrane subunit n=1 Tax=Phytomonospora endophytica TaxID=714109 RepID=A0A841FY03_9ACTN|nr:hypothetical protein [Phytomonospora endophytica]MBB6038598.1 DMSO/TMAO reductase YedYZ heme-binding membrane subunit [Phytomonospora endophytica]GIG69259.1 hypothetical protein Pen01_55540 [Phytomonospora endophytica]